MPVISDDLIRRTALGDMPEKMIRDSRLTGFAVASAGSPTTACRGRSSSSRIASAATA